MSMFKLRINTSSGLQNLPLDVDYLGGKAANAYATTTQLAAKQNTLVSGSNIKTVNGTSILGSGDITIEGGGGANIEVIWTGNSTSVSTLPMLPISDGYYILKFNTNAVEPQTEFTVTLPPNYTYGFYSIMLFDASQQTQMQATTFELMYNTNKVYLMGDYRTRLRSVTKVSM